MHIAGCIFIALALIMTFVFIDNVTDVSMTDKWFWIEILMIICIGYFGMISL